MKKLTSTKYTAGAFNLAMLILRAGLGGLMISNGYDKLVNYGKYRGDFMDFLGMGSSMSLALLVFAEFFCSLFLIFGLFSRLVTIPLIIAMIVAVTKAHNADVFGEGEHAALFVIGFLTILIVGPGKLSVDGMIGK
jgi:putative oxidoreductase